MSPAAFEPALLWAVLRAVRVVRAERRTCPEPLRHDRIQRTARLDGRLDPALRCPRPEWPEGPVDGIVLRGQVTNRTRSPVWDVLAETVDPRTGHSLPLVPLTRHVLPPGDEWPFEWICGCTVTAPEAAIISGRAEGNAVLPVPEILLGTGIARPQLRITFSDITGRWVRQGGWVAPATRDRQLPPGSAALSRASDELGDAASQDRAPDTSRIAIEVGLALHEVARRRLGRFSDSPLDLSALPALLTRHPLARRLRLEPGTAAPLPTEALPTETPRSLAALALAVRSVDELIGTASGRSPASAHLLLAHAGSVLTALNALRLGPDGSSADGSGR